MSQAYPSRVSLLLKASYIHTGYPIELLTCVLSRALVVMPAILVLCFHFIVGSVLPFTLLLLYVLVSLYGLGL
jgi:hypothetical protein